MNGPSAGNDHHPVDALPDYVRGNAEGPERIARHLEACEACRAELEILETLEGGVPAPLSDVERERAYRAFEASRAARPGPGGSPIASQRDNGWLRSAWRIAAAVALVLTGLGVWRVVQAGNETADWSPELALEGWEEELADLGVGTGDVRLAFGLGPLDDLAWEDLEGVDPFDVVAPWEDDR